MGDFKRYLIFQKNAFNKLEITHTEWVLEKNVRTALKKYAKAVLRLNREDYKVFLRSKLTGILQENEENAAVIKLLLEIEGKETWKEDLQIFLERESKELISERKLKQPELKLA